MNKLIASVSCFLILISNSSAEIHSINFTFEQSEEALNTLFKTKVFPRLIGNHDGDDYDIYIWEPSIDIEPGVVNFNFTIIADLVIGGEPVTHQYPLNLPLDFPEVDVSISGIITFLEGIPDQISSMDGPQWVKDTIITYYEGMELTAYPNQLLDNANEDIPESWDVTVGDFGFTWTAETDLLKFTIFTEIESHPILLNLQYIMGYQQLSFRMKPNVSLILRGYEIINLVGQNHEHDYSLDLQLTPGMYNGNSFTVEFGTDIGSDFWILELFISSDYGLWIFTYQFTSYNDYWTSLNSYSVNP